MTAPDEERQRHIAMITLPAGIQWSGRARYAAAMYFYGLGELDAETLEVYRICSRLDAEDPLEALRHYRVGETWIARLAGFSKP